MNDIVRDVLIFLGSIVVIILIVIIAIATTWPGGHFQNAELQAEEDDEKPDVYIVANETEIEIDDTVQFELKGNKGDLPITAEWDFGDGSELSYKKNPKHKYKVKGEFEVTLTVTDDDGDVDTEEKNIEVKDPEATDSDGNSNRIPVYNPYYFISAFFTLIAISMVLIKKRIS